MVSYSALSTLAAAKRWSSPPLSDSQIKTIQDAAKRRQCQQNVDTRLDDRCNSWPTESNSELLGQHRWCYKKFTNVYRLPMSEKSTSELLSYPVDSEQQTSRRSSRSNLQSTHGLLFPQDICMFCGKGKYYTRTKSKLVKCVTQSAESSIKEAAIANKDHELLSRVMDIDLIAKEARYHEYCRKLYIMKKREATEGDETGMGCDITEYATHSPVAHSTVREMFCWGETTLIYG